MRERLYVTTSPKNWNEKYCIEQSLKYTNVIIYSPNNKGVFLNGIRYGSVNEISKTLNNSTLFKLSIDEFNIIRLTQNDITRTIDKLFKYRGINLENGSTIKCHVNERIQILANIPVNVIDNQQYHWTSSNNNIVVIDGNNIITPKKISDKHTINLVNVNDASDIQFTINLKIYGENTPFISSVLPEDYDGDVYINDNDYNIVDRYEIRPDDIIDFTGI